MDWLEEQLSRVRIDAVGHRVVHGGPNTPRRSGHAGLMDELHRISPYDPDICRVRSS